MALLSLLAIFRLSAAGFHQPRPARRSSRRFSGCSPAPSPPDRPPTTYGDYASAAVIQRIPHGDRYLPTERGLRAALVLTQTHNRILTPALAAANHPLTDLPHLHRAIGNVKTALTRTPRSKDSPPETGT